MEGISCLWPQASHRLGAPGCPLFADHQWHKEIVNPFLEDRFGIDYLMAGLYTAVWGLGVVLGAVTGGRLTDRVGHRRAAMGALVMSLAAILALVLVVNPAMDISDARVAASMFAVLMAVANIGIGVAFAVTGQLVDAIGYRWTFVGLGLLNLLALPLLPLIFRGYGRHIE